MSKYFENMTMDNNFNIWEKYEDTLRRKKSLVKAGFSGVTAKGISFKFNTNSQSMKPLDLLEELHKICSNESLTKDEKNIEIRKMLEKEQ